MKNDAAVVSVMDQNFTSGSLTSSFHLSVYKHAIFGNSDSKELIISI